MKKYTSCFLGIPLPEKYITEFEQLLDDIHTIDPSLETVRPQTPHITIYYLNKQSQYSLAEINTLVQPFIESLHGITLEIGGFNYFTHDNPKVLFLDVIYSEILIAFKNKISEVLIEYNALENSLSFHPHMTVGRIKNRQGQKSFIMNKEKLALKLNAIQWKFEITEIALYGVDSTKSPEQQEKLVTIQV